MTAKPIIPRAQAHRDVESAMDYYVTEAGAEVAMRFIDGVEQAYRAISTRPATGSPKYSYELDLPGVRSRNIRRFPYTVFYVEQADHIDIWRVLHSQRDIPVWLSDVE